MKKQKINSTHLSQIDGQLVDELRSHYSKAIYNFGDYDNFLSSWRRIAAEQVDAGDTLSSDYSPIERFAVDALTNLIDNDAGHADEYSGRPLFHTLHNSAVICDLSGKIRLSNQQAMKEYGLSRGMSLDCLNLEADTGQRLSEKIAQLMLEKIKHERLSLIHCRDEGNDALIPMAIICLAPANPESVPQVLVIFLDAACSAETLALMTEKFGLTSAEADVMSAFSSGRSLKEIAADKHRSYATIRNQFQSALEKTGCPNQADLLRMLLGVSYLLSYTAMAASTNEEKPLGRKVEVMRPQGRFVEVRLYGDRKGKPFVLLPSLFGMPITPDIDRKLHERSLFMIGVWRPGFAGTSKPPTGISTYDCLAEDVTTVLDNLGIDRCPVLGRASAARAVFKLMNLIPERISNAFIGNSMVPRRYVENNKIMSRWTSSLVLASRFSPSLAVLILEAGQKLMLRHGAARFCQKMYGGSSADEALLENSMVVKIIFEGAKLATAPGMEASAEDILTGFEDWSSEVLSIKGKVTLLQGCSDPHISIEASRAFAAEFSDHIELVEFSDGGGLLSYTHTDEILNAIESSYVANTR